ncbi:MAG: nitronate monooxygenase [bacterium]|nr:nitronate monooxygenase [bacterium]
MAHPQIIQGGMGAGVSNWKLANAVSKLGCLGVVSGTALDSILARRLQLGDAGGHMRRAMAHFPNQAISDRVLEKYYIPNGKESTAPFKAVPLYGARPNPDLVELTVLANFVEVFLAKEGHGGLVGINYLEKIQLPNLPSLYGAMLADVDYVLMGAGIPKDIPGALDTLSLHQATALKIHIEHARQGEEASYVFDPAHLHLPPQMPMKRPYFLAIVASVTLAIALARKSSGRVDGLIIEKPSAGGHNAPPRGILQCDENGQPVYGTKDEVDLEKIRKLDLPFWMAGSYASPDMLKEARDQGAVGIQVGTAFAFCEESGLENGIKQDFLRQLSEDTVRIVTDPIASPTGFPFKVVQMETAQPSAPRTRERTCDLGYLRTAYLKPDGILGFRCPSEREDTYIKKGGTLEATQGRKCLCNALLANIGLPQQREDGPEMPLLTAGDNIGVIKQFITKEKTSYAAQEVIAYLQGH